MPSSSENTRSSFVDEQREERLWEVAEQLTAAGTAG
jgi:hypothetical protein